MKAAIIALVGTDISLRFTLDGSTSSIVNTLQWDGNETFIVRFPRNYLTVEFTSDDVGAIEYTPDGLQVTLRPFKP